MRIGDFAENDTGVLREGRVVDTRNVEEEEEEEQSGRSIQISG
jgi:hypothetical protein